MPRTPDFKRQIRLTQSLLIFGVAVVLLASACSRSESANSNSEITAPPVIYTTFYPTQYFCARIIGDSIPAAEIHCPLPDNADPIFWKPTREQVRRFQNADLIIINGAGFEKWLQTTALPQSRIVDTAQPLAANFIQFKTTTHSHGMTGGHTHAGIDGHTWLDPQNAKIQAGEILRALQKKYPAQADEFRANFNALTADLDALDQRFRALTPRLNAHQLYAAHPAYAYLAQRYHWSITNLPLTPEATLTPDELTDRAQFMNAPSAKKNLLLWQSEPATELASQLHQRLNLQSIVFAPAELQTPAQRAAGLDYLRIMQANLARLEDAVK